MLNGLPHATAGVMEVHAPPEPLISAPGDRASLTEQGQSTGVQPAAVLPEHIDELLGQGDAWLRFPPSLEAYFQQDRAHQRLKTLIFSGVLVSIMFNMMLVSDWLMIPDTLDLAFKLRLFIFTPCTIAGLFLITRLPSARLREWSKVVSGIGACCVNVYLCVSSNDPMAGPYLVALVPIVMFVSAVAQMRFVPALFMDGLILLLFAIGAVMIGHAAPIEIMIPAGLTLFSAVVFTLYGCYTLERDERRNWLLLLRERLLLKELGQANAHLDSLSRSDMLTEVANRRHFDEYLERLWDQARADGSELSLMMIDIDHFKAYNDRYGHPQGDACLKDVAAALKRRLRGPEDLIARYGGEEFIAVLGGTRLGTAVDVAERVRKGIENLNRLHATSSTHAVVTVSIGVACLRPNAPHATSAQLISAADEALYQAKSRGRNRVFAFGTHD
jgi:diguanylate cyclase (GGDEF)-like protein